ncbi:uncharacterized protein DUF1080 [Anseongella ginsenosidimutans]|uniref:Uncharacterized protein DUF1080 n=2 Tax=Anseongella ginsenosidimutans TaxID=496056 RepID=A0A4R3KW18_9SPHI|nr:DUF1080 domain-containing protein [Anseongella ginsenosidimutans]TCS89927.1 uncharacterized protein DUF1080 [Anseongella ginsenosidimutans]
MLATGCLIFMTACNPSPKNSAEQAQDTASLAPAGEDEGFVQLFDGESLEGWKGDTSLWRVENGNLVGEIKPGNSLENNSFIIWQGGTPGDFELKAEFRISEGGNSGINYRSELLGDIPNALRGYQADIDGAARYTGQNYEERGRTTLAYRGQKVTIPATEGEVREHVKGNAWTPAEVTEELGTSDSLKEHVKLGDWNEIRIVASGNHLQHYVNGVLMSDVTDNDTVNGKASGYLGVQVHVGPPMKVEYRNIRLKEL